MAERVHARLSPAAGRRFGVTVGAVLLALAALARWRGRMVTATLLGGLGVWLLGGGLLVPQHLGPVYRAWMGLAAALSRVTTPLFLAIVYFGVLAPTALLLRLVGHRPLRRRRELVSFWIARDAARGPDDMQHQF